MNWTIVKISLHTFQVVFVNVCITNLNNQLTHCPFEFSCDKMQQCSITHNVKWMTQSQVV